MKVRDGGEGDGRLEELSGCDLQQGLESGERVWRMERVRDNVVSIRRSQKRGAWPGGSTEKAPGSEARIS